jgi:hypothetical protein
MVTTRPRSSVTVIGKAVLSAGVCVASEVALQPTKKPAITTRTRESITRLFTSHCSLMPLPIEKLLFNIFTCYLQNRIIRTLAKKIPLPLGQGNILMSLST